MRRLTKTIQTNIILITLLILLILVTFGCTKLDNKSSGMMILDENGSEKMSENDLIIVKNGDKVSVEYTGRLEDGTIFDSSVGREPLDFVVGAGQMIKGFDEGVIGMKLNEKKFITIPPKKGYGETKEENIVTIEKESINDFEELKEGMIVSSGYNKGKVLSKTDTNAVIDFNHELAGKTLVFEVTLLSIN